MRKRCIVLHFEKGFKERDWQQGCDQKPPLTNITLCFIIFWLPAVVKKRTKCRNGCEIYDALFLHGKTAKKYIFTYIVKHIAII